MDYPPLPPGFAIDQSGGVPPLPPGFRLDGAPDPSEGRLPFSPFGVDTGLTMPQGVSRFMAGAGKAFTDLGRGAGQLAGIGPTQAETDETKRLDAPLMNTGAGLAGNLTGGLAAVVPTAMVPGANTYTGSALLGTALGAMTPTGTNDSRLLNMGTGTAASMGGQALGNLLGRVVRPVQSTLNPEEQRLAQVALNEGIPLDAAALTGSRPLQTVNSVMENLPFTAGKQLEQVKDRQGAFTAAALRRAGITGDSAVPPVLAAQKDALGNTFEAIASRNVLDFNKGLGYDLQSIADVASRRLPKDKAAAFQSTVSDLLDEAPKGIMEGAKYQGWRSELGRLANGNDAEAHYFGQLKKALDKEFNAQIGAADADAWKQASREYANLKTILNSMGGTGAAAAEGNIPPAQLAQALGQAIGKEGKALGRGDMNDLARVGSRFVRNQTPDSGTAQRMLYQSLLTGGGAAAGTVGAMASGKDPMEGMMYGAAGMGATLAGPRLAQAVLQSPLAQGYLTHQAGSPTAKLLAELLQNSGRSIGASAPLLLMNR